METRRNFFEDEIFISAGQGTTIHMENNTAWSDGWKIEVINFPAAFSADVAELLAAALLEAAKQARTNANR